MILPFTLTRYLYIKEDVMMSLIISIFQKNYDESLFWTSELYYSGYEEETTEFIISLYNNFFHSNNPKLQKVVYILKKEIEEKNIHLQSIAKVLKNLSAKPRIFTLRDFMQKISHPDILPYARNKETNLIIIPDKTDHLLYSSENMEKNIKYKYCLLKTVCKYNTSKIWAKVFGCAYIELSTREIFNKHINQWEYYASYSPLWNKRIEQYNGEIDHENEKVHFNDDDDFEEFHNNFNYDIDEQTSETIDKISHNKEIDYLNINDFYKKFEPNLKIRIIKKNKSNK